MTSKDASQSLTLGFFGISVFVMALKPVLLHLTREDGDESRQMVAAHFQLAAEALKFTLCSLVLAGQRALGQPAPLWSCWTHTLSFVPPAATYLIMNVLTVRAARLLPPPTFQLVANLKIICTALVAWIVLGRKLSMMKWLALALLTAGVTLGQWKGGESLDAPLVGVVIMLVNCWLSAFGGVLTERAMKAESNLGFSIFGTNMHMAAHTMIFNGAALVLLAQAGDEPFRRPSPMESLTLFNEAVNGILISLLMRRIDATAKNYAFSASIFVTVGLSIPVFQYWPSPSFYAGAGLTLASMALYARGGVATAAPPTKKST